MMKKQSSYWIQSGKFTLLERVSVLVFGVFTFILLVRILDKESYGTWMLFISLVTLVETARNGFFKNPLIRYLNKTEQGDRPRLQGTSLILNVVFSLLIALFMALISEPLSASWETPQLVYLLYLFIPISGIMAFFSHFDYVQRGNFNFSGPFGGYFIKNGLSFFIVAYYFFMDKHLDLKVLGIWYGIAALCGTLVSLGFAWKYLFLFPKMSTQWVKTLFSYGKYTLGTNLSAVLLRNIDIWMLGWYLTPAAVAIYNVAIRIANLFEVPSMALASILFPEAVRRAEKEGDSAMKLLYEKSVAIILVFSIPFVIFVFLFSETIVTLLAGEDYKEAALILNITMLYGLIIPFNKQMGVVLDAIGKAKINMLFVLRNALINVVLNVTFIPWLGIIGAALATLTTMVIVLGLNQYYLHKKFNIEMRSLLGYIPHYFSLIYKKALSYLK